MVPGSSHTLFSVPYAPFYSVLSLAVYPLILQDTSTVIGGDVAFNANKVIPITQ